jgi:murein DD-endopeptidase MepM/ murein hydrolase activator NlpD
MKKFIFYSLMFLPACALAQQDCNIYGMENKAPKLCGAASQGGLVWGDANGMDVYNDGTKISKGDVFVIGLDRDAYSKLNLRFCRDGKCENYSYKIAQRKYIEQNVDVPEKFTKYPAEVQERIDTENRKIVIARGNSMKDTNVYFKNFSLPENLREYRISGVYGSRRIFNGVPKSPHKGLDFAAPTGTAVYPIADGVVVLAEEHYMNGNIIFVSHGHGVLSAYLHLDKIDAKVGDLVDKKTKIGSVGGTGRASGPHLHMGLYHGQTALDPALFILEKTK